MPTGCNISIKNLNNLIVAYFSTRQRDIVTNITNKFLDGRIDLKVTSQDLIEWEREVRDALRNDSKMKPNETKPNENSTNGDVGNDSTKVFNSPPLKHSNNNLKKFILRVLLQH